MTPNTENAAKEDGSKPLPASQFWITQLSMAKQDHKSFFEYGKKVESRYKNSKDAVARVNRGKRFQILYSNTEVLKAALYARTAKPDVRQRFTYQKDELARTAGDMMERVLSYCADTTHHDRSFRQGVHDLCLPGRGVVWIEYEPVIGTDDMGQEIVVDQKVDDAFVYYRDFLHSPAKCWAEVWWIARRKLMTRDDMKDAGFKDAETIPLNWAPDMEQRDKEVPESLKRAEVWEVWHKSKKERIFVVEGHPKVARVDPDPYGLQGFWPCAEPCQAITSNDNFVPCALFSEYEDQADDLDEITERISKLTRALKRRGVYDASVKELRRLSKANDNEFIPAENWGAFAQNGGLKGAYQTEDLKPIAETLLALYQTKDMLVQTIYEIMGVSDIMRGNSDASETATAQQLKAQFGSARVKTMQGDVQRWIRDTLRIKAELVAEQFEPQVLLAITGMKLETEAERAQKEAQEQAQKMQQWQMAAQQAMQQGQPPPPQPQPEPPDEEQEPTIDAVVALLRDDKLRSYQIDIETDSTVFEDAEAEKESRTELLSAMAGFMQQWMPIVQTGGPSMLKLAFESLEFAVRGFRAGRQLEEALEECREALTEQQEQQANQPPPPDPAIEREKIKMEADKMRAEADMKLKGVDLQLKQMDLQAKGAEIEIKKQSLAIDQEAKAAELGFKRQQMEMDLTGKQIAMEYDSRAREHDFEGKRRMMELDYAGRSAESERKAKDKEQADKDKSESKERAEKPKRVKFERDESGKITGGTVS
jgi:hypothetical protein